MMCINPIPGVYYYPPCNYSMQERQAIEQAYQEFQIRLEQAVKAYEER